MGITVLREYFENSSRIACFLHRRSHSVSVELLGEEARLGLPGFKPFTTREENGVPAERWRAQER